MSTPNMNLTLPVVGVTAGPAYASQVNAALTVVDGHDHSSGSGVQITPSGLNINAELSFNENDAADLRTVRFTSQPAALPGSTPDLGCLYVVNDNLYYNDGIGNQIAITSGGSIAGASGNITGLVSPASVVYTSGGSANFKFMSTASVSANLDAASYLIRNPGVTATYALTLQAPTLSSNYSLTLPVPPAASSFMQIDSSGVMTNTIPTSLGITAANLAADAVTTAKILDGNVTSAKIAAGTIVNSNIADGTITSAKLAFIPTITRVQYNSNGTFVVPTGINNLGIVAVGGGGGGGGGGGSVSGGGGGGGGAGGHIVSTFMNVTPGETLTITVGAGGAGAAGAQLNGSAGNASEVSATGSTVYAVGGAPGSGGSGVTPGSGGAAANVGGSSSSTGGNGGGSSTAGDAGIRSSRALAVAGMAASGIHGGGGSGGASYLAAAAQVAGNDGTNAAANSGAGGGGGSGGTSGQTGGNGGSGVVLIYYVPLA